MTVCDIGCASSAVCAERFRTVTKSFTARAHTPADLRGYRLDANQDFTGAYLDVRRRGAHGSGGRCGSLANLCSWPRETWPLSTLPAKIVPHMFQIMANYAPLLTSGSGSLDDPACV
jgi:hypothetical protein